MAKRVLLSTIGSRGDVQPLVALALAVRAHGCEVRVCVPPDFRAWIEGLGVAVVTIGPELRGTAKPAASATRPTPEQIQALVAGTVTAQFAALREAARDCDLIVGATALQLAAPSVAEMLGLPYVFAAYCPAVLPSPHHAPPLLAMLGDTPARGADYRALWEQDARRWNATWKAPLDAGRAALGLGPVDDVRAHVLTTHPWLAADPVLAPWAGELAVVPAGAWLLPDERSLPAELEAFLAAGAPPVYVGFGSIRAPEGLARAAIEAARWLGRRVIVSRGWAELGLIDDASDCLAIDDVSHAALFPRVAAVVHHGGAGTTTAAARAGAPQVIVPQHYDQPYWAQRVAALGIGAAHTPSAPTTASLVVGLEHALRSDVGLRAREIASAVRLDGAAHAAARLVGLIT